MQSSVREKAERNFQGNLKVSNCILRPLAASNLSAFFALLAINWICCGSSLNLFFFAEDANHVTHAYQVVTGAYHCLWSNFYSSWMNGSETAFYRPLPELSFVSDFLIFGTNSYGYHLTNFIWHQLATFLFFAATFALLNQHMPAMQARLAAFLSAALFSVCPLHPEAIYWLVNRTDLICVSAMMASWYCFIKSQSDGTAMYRYSILSSVSLVLALMSKETAIATPALLFATHLFMHGKTFSLKDLLNASRATRPYWIVLGVYAGCRLLMFGGVGGYINSGGTLLSDTLFIRITSFDDWIRCVYPVNETISSNQKDSLRHLFSLMYAAGGILVLLRLWQGNLSIRSARLVFFASASALITLAPAVQLWSIYPNLGNSRLLYLPSALLALMIVAVILPFAPSNTSRKNRIFVGAATVWLGFFIALCGATHLANNKPWHDASNNLRAIYNSVVTLAKELPQSHKMAVLNLPLDERFPQTLCCHWNLLAPVTKPFCDEDLSNKVFSTQLTWFRNDIKNMSRIKEFTESPKNHAMLWDTTKMQLVPCALEEIPPLGASLESVPPEIRRNPTSGEEPILIYNLPKDGFDARAASLIKITTTLLDNAQPTKKNAKCAVVWTSWDRPQTLPWETMTQSADPHQPNTIYAPIGERVSWRLSPRRLKQLILVPSKGYKIQSVELLNESSVTPTIKTAQKPLPDGFFVLHSTMPTNFNIEKVLNATSAVLEISKPNVRYYEQSHTYRDRKLSNHSSRVVELSGKSGNFVLTRSMFGRAARYDVRVAALSPDGKVVGFTSDPLEIEVK